MNTKYWKKLNIDPGIMGSFKEVYGLNLDRVRVTEKVIAMVYVSDIADTDNPYWVELLEIYFIVLKRFEKSGRRVELSDTQLYKKDYSDAPKGKKWQVERRFDRLYELFQSIKKHGYEKRPNKLLRLLDTRELKPRILKGSRISKKYYRLEGMRRCIICSYLGIKKIPVKLFKIKVVKV